MSGASDPSAWMEKARQDARAVRRLLADPPELGVAAYHLHQAVEKAAKSILTAEGIEFPRAGGTGHDLDRLARLIPAGDPLRAMAEHLSDMTPWATAFRYPADDPLTAQPLPTKPDIENRLRDVESFVEAAAQRIAPP